MLSAVTKVNRHEAMGLINDAVVDCGGWVEGHTLLSNFATVFRFELPASGLQRFLEKMESLSVRLDEASLATATEVLRGKPSPDKELPLSLNVTFIHNEPDLKQTIPAVPG